MYIPLLQSIGSSPRAAAASTAQNPASNAIGGLDTMFLQLLTAQLKAQSPIDPLDPNQFVGQLAQFQSLSTLAQIQQLVQTLVTNTTSAKPSNSQPSSH